MRASLNAQRQFGTLLGDYVMAEETKLDTILSILLFGNGCLVKCFKMAPGPCSGRAQ